MSDIDDDDDYMTPKHRALLRQYYDELREAKQLAEAWWGRLIGSARDEAAKTAIRKRWPNGPASHPFVIGVIAKTAHACDRLNRTLDRGDRVPVSQFIIGALDSTETQDLVSFTQSLTYWPLGTGEDNRIV
jgi:hypothetical protein